MVCDAARAHTQTTLKKCRATAIVHSRYGIESRTVIAVSSMRIPVPSNKNFNRESNVNYGTAIETLNFVLFPLPCVDAMCVYAECEQRDLPAKCVCEPHETSTTKQTADAFFGLCVRQGET